MQLVNISCGQRLQVTQHQRGNGVATGQFNLRAGITGIQAGDQRAQRQQQGAHMRRQDGATAHVGNVAALALMKTDQHLALFQHVPHRQARPPAVTPCRAVDRAQHGFRLAFAQVPKVVFEHPLFHCHLRRRFQVLHLATAAGAWVQAEVRTARRHAQR